MRRPKTAAERHMAPIDRESREPVFHNPELTPRRYGELMYTIDNCPDEEYARGYRRGLKQLYHGMRLQKEAALVGITITPIGKDHAEMLGRGNRFSMGYKDGYAGVAPGC